MPVEKDPPVNLTKVVRDERIHKITGFFLILIAVGLGISFVSYLSTWQADQDKVFNAGGDFFWAEDIKVENRLGKLGAWAGHQFIYKGFGLASFFLCLLPFTVGINLIFKKRIFRIWRNVFYAVTGLVFFSVALAFATQGASFSYGGGWGEWMSESLTALMGQAGTALLLLVTGIAWLVWRFNPVFNVPKVPKVEVPTLFKRGAATTAEADDPEADTMQPPPAVEPAFSPEAEKKNTPLPRQGTPLPAPVPSTPAEATAPGMVAAPEGSSTVAATGLSINDLYAMGKHNELAKRKHFEVLDDPNPLEVQTVQGGPNTLKEEGSMVAVVLPAQEDPLSKDPINQLTVADKVNADIPLTIVPGLEEPADEAVVVLPPQPTPPVATPAPAAKATPMEATPPPAPEPPTPAAATSIYPVTVVPASMLELEIKPPAPDSTGSHDDEDDAEVHPAFSGKPVEQLAPYDPKLDLESYEAPSLDLLETHGSEKIVTNAEELESHKNQILTTLKNYDITIQRISATVGPTVTLYEIVPAPGVRISRIKNLEDDIALSLSALGIRIIAPIPGRGTIGIEVPNVRKSIVSMRTLLASDKFQHSQYSLPIAIGKKIDNEHFVVDLASMPHLLMAGATGQGKSVGINAVLVSLLYKKHPSQLKLVLVDPKKVELSLYRVIEKHFLAKLPGEEEAIITDTRKVINTLNALCIEMDNRYDLLKEAHVRNIREYNEKFVKRRLNPEKGHQFLPFIVLVVDEFADLIMTAGKEVEMPIARLAQLARAVGIHLIIATQRPSVNIITGTIKANFPSRIAFKVSSKIDSRTILDAGGAEQLIGKGDMLISHNGEIIRLQCAFVDTPEVERVCEAIGTQRGYAGAFLLPEYEDEKSAESRDLDMGDRDSLFEEAARLIVQHQQGSTSLIQRRMKLGYNRAGRLMDQLERAGIVGPGQGSKPRDVLIKSEMELAEILDGI